MSNIWSCDISLKIKCFLWLAIENRISTWDNMVKKGWIGPNRCNLCKGGEESVYHIFTVFPYTVQIFNCMSKRFNLRVSWSNNSLLENMENWLSQITVNSHLPIFIIWCIWISRKQAIFYSREATTSLTCLHILSLMNDYPTSHKPQKDQSGGTVSWPKVSFWFL